MTKEVPVYQGKGWFGFASEILVNIMENTQALEGEYGDFYRIKRMPLPFYVTFRPSIIKHVLQTNAKNYKKSRAYDELALALGNGLVTSSGDFWKKQRRMAQPAFHKERLKTLFESMVDISTDFVEDLRTRTNPKEAIEIGKETMQVTADIVLRTLFSSGNYGDRDKMHHLMVSAQEYIIKRIQYPFQIPLQYVNGGHQRFLKDLKMFDDIVLEVIRLRRASKERPADFLTMLLEATDIDTGEGMTDEQLRDEAITIFAAGHETSANALAWTLYLLAQHPEIVQKMRDEVNAVLGGRKASFQDLQQLTYIRQVVDEGMRLYPPAHSIGRQTLVEDMVEGTKVEKGAVVFINVYALHRSPQFWENPNAFNPERFTAERVKTRPRLHYLPFGAGARMCIGNSFAIMEMQLLLAVLVQNFNFRVDESHVIETQPLITLRPKNGIKLFLEPI